MLRLFTHGNEFSYDGAVLSVSKQAHFDHTQPAAYHARVCLTKMNERRQRRVRGLRERARSRASTSGSLSRGRWRERAALTIQNLTQLAKRCAFVKCCPVRPFHLLLLSPFLLLRKQAIPGKQMQQSHTQGYFHLFRQEEQRHTCPPPRLYPRPISIAFQLFKCTSTLCAT